MMLKSINTAISFGLLIAVVGGSFYYVYATAPIKPWTGITEGLFLSPAAVEALGLEQERGFLIFTIASSSPADKAGLRGGGAEDSVTINGIQIPIDGDIIVSMDGRQINGIDDVCGVLAQKQVGDNVMIEASRAGKLLQANVILEELPPGETTKC